ncbi:MAG: Stk1 family PASTA domain-containing Ser/Thr kinase [Lachnospiraceae bacterium]|nr:Stk1 family PASTA domain-containing Ser/Thr kinase [Lachnospiraceae bacterium]
MIRTGMMISERYEILEKIGTGGMSDVYKAKDHKLNRFVAVKVLKQEFSENANFVSKFRVEAQAAAGLMHPNIVNVYDVGQEEGVHFIVMELVEGITLKKYIEKKARLSVKEAISIAIQVSMGIEAAHKNHIIHRDIKPQNIIISKDGKVKVTDFGIAKAATSNTITSNVMGSVHYTSPEQARGGYSDEKSDIYSLGITFFEMLTGRVPFNGETTVAIAIKHIQEEMPSPREFVSEIPVSVEQIVLKCCQKSPDRRYQSMEELIADLKYALMNPDEDFVKIDDPDEVGATKTVDDEDVQRIKRQSSKRESLEDTVSMRTEREVIREAAKKESARTGQAQRKSRPAQARNNKNRYYQEYPEDQYDDYDDRYDDESDSDPRMEKITTILAVVAAALIGLIVLILIARFLGVFDVSEDKDKDPKTEETAKGFVTMIDVVGKNADDIKKELIDMGLTPEIEYEESSEYAQGIVMRSSVEGGAEVEEGSNVIITVSAGETGVEVPDTVGKTLAEAKAMLVDKGFVPQTTEMFDQYIQEGSIVKQSPDAGTKAPAGTAVSIFVSKGPEISKIAVPNLLSKDEETAMAVLAENGLELGTVTEVNYEDPAYEGLVCEQSPQAGEYLDAGSKVNISISLGPIQSTYKFTDTIQAPTAAEDPNFKLGTTVTVTMTADDGTVLLSTQTSSFPISEQNITGIKSESGTILFQYINQGESSVVTNADGNTVTVEGQSETKEIKRQVSFVAE